MSNGEETKQKVRDYIVSSSYQYKIRKENEDANNNYNLFLKSNTRVVPVEPVEETYLVLDPLHEVDLNIKKPLLEMFDTPTITFNKLSQLYMSQRLIPLYNESQKLLETIKEIDGNLDELLLVSKEQLNIRSSLIKTSKQYDELLTRVPIEYIKPEEDKYFELESYIPIDVNIRKPRIDIFDLPSIEYNKFQSLIKSYDLVKLYQEFQEITNVLTQEDKILEFNDTDIFGLETNKRHIIESIANIKCLKESLVGIIQDDPDIENKIKNLTDVIIFNEGKILAGKAILEIININNVIQSYESKRNEIVTYVSSLTELYTYIQELGTNCLQTKIDEVNVYLSMILDDLFKDNIEVELSSHKTLKNGDQKLQINFNVDYKGHKLKGTEGFSEGEEERLSVALLMVFSRMNTSPIIIIDEVLAGMNEELRLKCIQIIENWSTGKFVIHICHSIIQGSHSNIIKI